VDNNALRAALLDTNPATAFNPFSINQNSPAVINKIFVTTHRLGTASLMLEDLKLYGNLWNLPAGPIALRSAVSTGLSTKRISLTGSQLPVKQLARLTYSQLRGAVTSGPATGRFRVPVTSPAWNCPGLYSLELGYQERYDNYSDFGSTERPKVFFRWQPIDSSLTFARDL